MVQNSIRGDMMQKMEFVTKAEAKKFSKIKTKGLEDHLLMRLGEYQRDLFNHLYDPVYYDYDYETLLNRINAVLNQLEGRSEEEVLEYEERRNLE